jgi:hypothetical protein
MCVQQEDMLKASNGGSINYVKDNRKRNYHNNNQGSPSKPHGKGPQQYHQLSFPVDKDSVSTARRLDISIKIIQIGSSQ